LNRQVQEANKRGSREYSCEKTINLKLIEKTINLKLMLTKTKFVI